MVVHQFALTVSALLAGVVSGVTFTAEFEKTLETQLAKIKQDLEAYPDLQPVVEGVPQDVAGWKALSLDETLTKLRLFSSQKADEMPFLYALDRENTAKLTKFATDGHDLVMQITDFLASDSGEASLVPVEGTSSGAAPAPPASLPATGASATGASAAVPAAGAAVNGAATTTKTAISTTVSIPAAAGSATSTVSGSSSAVASPAVANVAAGGNTAAASAAVSVSVGDKSVQTASSNVAANVLSLSTTGLFSDTNSTGSNSTDTASADDVGVDGNKSANPLPTPVSSASRSLLSVVAASAAAIVLTTVM